ERGRLVQPASGGRLMREMEDLSSPVGSFLRSRCVTGPGNRVETSELYTEWKSWCEEHGKREPGTQEMFARDLRAAVPYMEKTRPRNSYGERVQVYTYIRIKTHEEMSQDPEDGQPGHSGHSDSPLHAKQKSTPSDIETQCQTTVTTVTNLDQHSPDYFRSQMLPD